MATLSPKRAQESIVRWLDARFPFTSSVDEAMYQALTLPLALRLEGILPALPWIAAALGLNLLGLHRRSSVSAAQAS